MFKIKKVTNRILKHDNSYKKDFNGWNKLKKRINDNNEPIKIRNGEIWWCSIGVNIDCEQDGKNENFDRPVLIFRKLARNKFYGIPLSTKEPRFDNYSHKFNYSNKTSYALLDQMRVFSTNRLEMMDCSGISKKAYAIICSKLKVILGFSK